MSLQTTQEILDQETMVPTEIVHLVQSGKRALENGDLDKALDLFEAVISQYPDRPEGYNNLGALHTSLGLFQKAEACFGKVLELLPGNCNVHYNRGVVRIRLQKFEEAIADFNVVLAVHLDDADCWNNLGVAYFLKQDFPTARSHFEHALSLVPNFPNALLNLCDSDLAEGNQDHAITSCVEYLTRYTDNEVRQKLLELLHNESRDLVSRACKVAEDLLAAECKDPFTLQIHHQLQQAHAILTKELELP